MTDVVRLSRTIHISGMVTAYSLMSKKSGVGRQNKMVSKQELQLKLWGGE